MLNDTILENCNKHLESDTLLNISKIAWQICGFVSIIIGIPGHCFQIIILSTKVSRKEPTNYYLMGTAICELIFLGGLFWLWLKTMSIIEKDPRQVLSCGIFYSILIGSTTLSNLYLALLSIDRSLIILCPTRYRSIVTQRHVLFCIIVISIIVLILLIPHHFYLYYDVRTTLFLCDFHSTVNHHKVRLWAFVHSILFVAIPSLIVCISSLILLHNRCKHNRTYKNSLSESARKLHRRAIVIFFVSLAIFFSFLPFCFLELYIVHDQLILHRQHCSARWRIYRTLLNFFLILTSISYSIKFYVHLCIASTFRRQFVQFISCKLNFNASRITNNQNQQWLLTPIDQRTRTSSKSNECNG